MANGYEPNDAVALESTVFSRSGLSDEWHLTTDGRWLDHSEDGSQPINEVAYERVRAAIKSEDKEPIVTGYIDGTRVVGANHQQRSKLFATDTKVTIENENQVRENGETAVTTIATALRIAHDNGLQVLATGGLGGVYLDHKRVSGDLDALKTTSLVVFTAGFKSLIDQAASIEALQAKVPMVGWQTHKLANFYSADGGLKVDKRVDSEAELVELLKLWSRGSCVVVNVPIPAEFEIPFDELQQPIRNAFKSAEQQNIAGEQLTPFVLKELRDQFGERIIKANVALLENNAKIAASTLRHMQ